MIIAVVC